MTTYDGIVTLSLAFFFHVPSERRGSRAEGQLINKSREKKLAAISLYICWLFIFCHAWKLIPTAYEVKLFKEYLPTL